MASTVVLSLLTLVPAVVAQQGICGWQQIRAGVVRDTLWLEGGLQYEGTWTNNKWDNCASVPGNYGSLHKLNFSRAFNTQTTDFGSIVEQINETDYKAAPIWVDGSMVTNDFEWYTFGGQALSINTQSQMDGIVHDGLYQPNNLATNFDNGLNVNYMITANITKYVTYGAGVNVPSELLSFYFSGFQTANGSRLGAYGTPSSISNPLTLVDSMLMVDTSSFNVASWTEIPLPPTIAPRAGASLVWVPAGSRGLLVSVGGVVAPADMYSFALNSSQTAANVLQGTAFVSNASVFDVSTRNWYVQPTTGDAPPAFAQACTVVASASDGSSHQIYVYGGWSGAFSDSAYDDVYILSVPAFVWIKVPSTNANHGRYAHYCAKPYPNQMISVGGVSPISAAVKTQSIIDVFDLNNLTWTGSYDPAKWSNYSIPAAVTAVIGGNAQGGSTLVASNMNSNVGNLFNTKYTKTITSYYPYTPQATVTPAPGKSSSSAVKIAVPVVVVVVVLVTAVIAWCCFCSPKARRRRSQKSTEVTDTTNNFVSRWVNGTTQHPPPPPKSVVSSDITEIGDTYSPRHEVPGFSYFTPHPVAAEADGAPMNGRAKMYSPTTRATSPTSPGSHTSAELEAPHLPPLLSQLSSDSSQSGNQRYTEVFRTHPIYPPSIDGGSVSSHALSGRYANARAPTESSLHDITAYELPPNRSNENVNVVSTPDESKLDTATEVSAPISSEAVSEALRTPDLVPHRPMGDLQPQLLQQSTRSHPPSRLANITSAGQGAHHRSTSSASSGIAITMSPTSPETARTVSPNEELRRSAHIANLPQLPRGNVIAIAEQRQAEAAAAAAAGTTNAQLNPRSAYEMNNDRMGGSK